jgi:lysophospholipase L1-like esterase
MKNRPHSIVIVFSLLFLISFSSKTATAQNDVLPASLLSPFGRCTWNDNHDLELISSAVNFGFSFTSKECKIFAYITDTSSSAHNYLQYELDGVYQKRIKVVANNRTPFTITTSNEGTHTVWIYKATEAQTGPIFIEKITGQNIQSIKRHKLPLIEFIGNSITCGAAADTSEVSCGTGVYHDQHNAYCAYGPRVARTLNVNFILSSVSGIGIYRNWNSDGPTMPQVYEKTDLTFGSNRLWDFSSYTPDVVSIALGTNDFSNGDGKHKRLPFDSATFVSNYIKFVQLVKSKYPKARIALLSSPMINGSRRVTLQNCLSDVKKNIDRLYPFDKKVAVFFFEPMQPGGCSGHPSIQDHAVMAEELIPFFKKLLSK